MTQKLVPLELIDDNPFNPHTHYPRAKIDELVVSIRQHGVLQTPKAREVNGRFQLAFGHARKRAVQKLNKEDPKHWDSMLLDVIQLDDDKMFHDAVEENLRRTDLTPIELARSVDAYLTRFPLVTEEALGKSISMTQGNISNMRRVLKLPDTILEKIDEGKINFTMGRELLVLEGLSEGRELMLQAVRKLKTEASQWGELNTVEGMQKAIHSVAREHFKALQKGYSYRDEILFDAQEAGCHKCVRMLHTYPTKSTTSLWCTDKVCWQKKQDAQKATIAQEAKAKMEKDILARVSQDISQEIPVKTAKQLADEHLAEQIEHGQPTATITAGKKTSKATKKALLEVATKAAEQLQKTGEEVKPAETREIPPEVLELAKQKAGTRAEVLDMKDLTESQYSDRCRSGVDILCSEPSKGIDLVDNPLECLESCTHGFHYAFDSRAREPRTYYVCSDTKCLAHKRAAFTRKKNVEKLEAKRAEVSAIKQVIASTQVIGRPAMKLILWAQVKGLHIASYYGTRGIKSPEKWLWDKLSAGTTEDKRNLKDLFERVSKLSDVDLAQLVVEMMFYNVTYQGDVELYQVQAEEPLKWFGVTPWTMVKQEEQEAK